MALHLSGPAFSGTRSITCSYSLILYVIKLNMLYFTENRLPDVSSHLWSPVWNSKGEKECRVQEVSAWNKRIQLFGPQMELGREFHMQSLLTSKALNWIKYNWTYESHSTYFIRMSFEGIYMELFPFLEWCIFLFS